MAGYIGSKSSVTQVDGYSEAEADAEFVNDPNGAITVSGSNVGIGTSSALSGPSPATALRIGNQINIYEYDDGGNPVQMNINQNIDTNENYIVTDQAARYQMRDGVHKWFTVGSGTAGTASGIGSAEKMRIDSSGNVGIGTSSPSAKLTVASSGNAGLTLRQNTTADRFKLFVGDGTGGYSVDENFISSNNTNLRFLAGGSGTTEVMRITSSGNVGIGRTDPSHKVDVYTGADDLYNIRLRSDRAAGQQFVSFEYSGSNIGTIVGNGTSTSYNTSSDYRLKEDWVPMTGASERVLDLKPVNFAWKVDGRRVDGFLAHELQEVVPEAATGAKDAMKDEEYEVTPAVEATYDEDGNELTAAVEAVMGTRSVPDYQGIDQSKLVPLLTAALQEALTEIASLKTRVEALEA